MRSVVTNVSGGLEAFLSIISLILIFVLVLVMAYFATKFVAKHQTKVLSQKSNISIIESFRLGNNRFIAIVKITDNYYALALGKEEITVIDELDSEYFNNLSELTPSGKKLVFKDILSKIKNNDSENEDIKNDDSKED